METLLVVLILAAVLWSASTSNTTTPAVAGSAPATPPGHKFVKTVTVTVDDPSQLSGAIDSVRRSNTGRFFGPNYTVGAPQITANGLTANISLFEEIDA